jgi:AcrR family transcriptional regulator
MSSELSNIVPDRRQAIVAAALEAFSRFGYRRAVMADIAAAAGISRPLLYTVFPNKAAVFRALAETLMADAIAAAEAAWPADAPIAEGLAAAILAKDLPIQRLLAATPHAAEILREAEALAGDLHHDTTARFLALAGARLGDAGLARLVINAADGVKHARLDEATYMADVRRLATMIAAGSDQPA